MITGVDGFGNPHRPVRSPFFPIERAYDLEFMYFDESFLPTFLPDPLTEMWTKPLEMKREVCRISVSIPRKTRKPGVSVSRWAKIIVTSFKETLFCLEIRGREGNEWPVAPIAKSFSARAAAAPLNVMKGLCNSYTRSARGNPPSAVWKRLGTNWRPATWLLSGGEMVAVTCC